MKTLVPVTLALLWSAAALGEPATISSETSRLEIPSLVIDGRVALKDVEFIVTDVESGQMEIVDYEFSPLRGNLPRQQDLAFGESIIFSPNRELRFIGVLSDSRCPSDVVCIHAGEVTVILRMTETLSSGNTVRTDFGLTHLGTDISYFEHDGVYFRLADVTPYPLSIQHLDEEDYTISLEYQSVPFRF